jgi:hypothetical protein
MSEKGFKRKLTAIISADVVGYSRLMDDDEEATIRTLTTYRKLLTSIIQQYRGKVVDTTGDNLLAEFASAVDAVNCAVEIQRELAERNTDLPYERKMEFRIGVNVGDVVEEQDRIYGDGVNIAARVEGLADAKGICISGRVYDQVENKLEFRQACAGIPSSFSSGSCCPPSDRSERRYGEKMAESGFSRSVHSDRSSRGLCDLELLFTSSANRTRLCGEDGISITRETLHCRAALCQPE